MGIPLWENPPTRSLDKSLASSRCNTHPSQDEESGEWTIEPSRSGSSSVSSVTSSATSTGTSTATVVAHTARDEATPRSRRDGSSSTDNSMLTLDEFLRETSQASAASNEAEHHLQTLLLMHRRGDRDRAGSENWRRSLFDHTPAASARLRFTAPAPGTSLSPPSPTGNDRPGIDSFDTLVGQIRRIGALQDAMLSTVDSTTASLEDSTINRSGAGTTADGEPSPNRRERNRSAVDSLRVREARLRAMQTRIDLLASEFQLLRSTRRELRRVEQQALEIQDSRNGTRAGAPEDGESQSLLSPERRTVRRAFLQQPEAESSGTASSALTTPTNTTAENSEPSPPTPVSIDRRSPTMTEDERDLILRNTVMQMQIESLAAAWM